MSLIQCFLGEQTSKNSKRFHTLKDAEAYGAANHTADRPASIETIPAGGGPVSRYIYDEISAEWHPHVD